jgi:hypothetical protein
MNITPARIFSQLWCCLFLRAMSSASGKEQFMKQFDAIVEGIKQNKLKVSTS